MAHPINLAPCLLSNSIHIFRHIVWKFNMYELKAFVDTLSKKFPHNPP